MPAPEQGVERRQRVADLAQELIRRPSVTPDDAGCQKMIARRLADAGFQASTLRFGEVDNLWARRGGGSPLFVFAGHTDVVPPGPPERWLTPPFEGRIEQGRLHGRGAADMKGSLAAIVIAAESFVSRHPDHMGSIAFLLTSDEEGPAVDGTKRVVEYLLEQDVQIDYCVVGEPTSQVRVADMIKVGRRGSLTGAIRIEGKQGHVAYPHLASNPVPAAARLLTMLCDMHWDEGSDAFPPTTFQVSNLHAGTGAGNVIPGHVDILCNFRFSPQSSPGQLKARVDACCRQLGVDYHIDWTLFGMPFETPPGVLRDAVTRSITEITGRHAEISTSGGTSDGRFIAPTGAQVIELGPVNETIHRANEHVDLDDLVVLSKIHERILDILLARETAN